MARPKSDKYNIETMISIIEEYTKTIELPILKEVCYQNKWNYDYVMQLQRDNEELSQSIKTLLDKKETQLERGGLSGKYNNTMAIFSLKQLGWRDNKDIQVKDMRKIEIVDDLPNEINTDSMDNSR